ncbi:MAG: HrpA family ATP-dependent helicase, partial [Actinomyces urogenitalis DORA_12]
RAAGQTRTSASAASTSSPWQPNVDGRQAASAGTAASSPAALQPPPARPAPHSHAPTEDRDQVTGILDAVDELMAAGPGDILVFLAGERDIRDTESALIDHLGPRYTMDGRTRTPGAVEVVPLYSRLTAAEQHR